jgi:acetate kinase
MTGTILVINPGSSTLKLGLLAQDGKVLRQGTLAAGNPGTAIDEFLAGAAPPAAYGVRVVHGGTRLRAATAVDSDILNSLAEVSNLAPLHNLPAVAAMRHLLGNHPKVPVVACFDTAFFAHLPEAAATYAIPWRWTEEWGIRRFGFHGLSHAYACRRAAEILGRDVSALRTVTCHLGAGASLAAVRGGIPVDTTMGFTPMEGLVMATRSGSVDPGALLWVQREKELSAGEMEQALDRESGLLGISGVGAGMSEVLGAEREGNRRAALAIEVYLHRLRGLIASMTAAMGGLDALVFTGGVGENVSEIRSRSVAGLEFLGIAIDEDANRAATSDSEVSSGDSQVKTLVVASREDLEMAREVRAVLGWSQASVP